MQVSRRQLFVLGFIAMLIAAPAGAMVADYLTDPVDTEDVTLRAANGPAVELTGATTSDLTQPFPNSDTVEWRTSDGNLTASGADGTNISVAASDLRSDTVRYSNLNVTAGAVTISHETHADLTLEGDTDWFEHHQLGVDDSQTDFKYAGTSGSTTVTLRGLPSNRQIGFVDVDAEQVLAAGDTDGSGTVTVTLPNSEHTIQLMTGEDPSVSDASPRGDLSRPPGELSIQLNDTDYPNDNHTVEFYLDNSLVATKQANQNGTVSASITPEDLVAGEHSWRVEVTDGYGNTREPGYSFRVPDTLVVRNESFPDQLVNETTVEVTFYGSDQIINRETSNGSISLEGLPVGDQLIVSADAENYSSRTTALDSLYQQQSVYLLPNETETVDIRFVLEDETGEFPSDSVLYVERPLTQNGTPTYRTIVSDGFGVQGVRTELEKGVRYQLRIKSPEGEVAILGQYTPEESEIVPLSPDTGSIDLSDTDDEIGYDAYRENDAIQIEYTDPTEETDHLTVEIYERGNESNQLRAPRTYYDLGNLSLAEPMNPQEQNQTWVVELTGERENGKEISARITIGDGPRNLIPGDLDDVWQMTVGVFILLVSSLIFSQLNLGVGAVTTSLTGGILWYLGLLEGVATGASVVLAIMVAGVYTAVFRR